MTIRINKNKYKIFRKVVFILAFIPILMFLIYGVYVLASYSTEAIKERGLSSEAGILNKVKSHVALPDEEPLSIMKVNNSEELVSSGEMFVDIKKGNYILVYPKLVILYDYERDKIIDINRKK